MRPPKYFSLPLEDVNQQSIIAAMAYLSAVGVDSRASIDVQVWNDAGSAKLAFVEKVEVFG